MKALKLVALTVLLVAVWALPAGAHHNTVAGNTQCQANGQAKVTWTIRNSESNRSETAVLTGALSKTIAIAAGGTATEVHFVAGNQGQTLTLYVAGTWSNGVRNSDQASVTLAGTCTQPTTTTAATTTTSTTKPPVVVGGATVVLPSFTG